MVAVWQCDDHCHHCGGGCDVAFFCDFGGWSFWSFFCCCVAIEFVLRCVVVMKLASGQQC